MARILIVDDDPDFVEITRIILKSDDYEVIDATNGKQALIRMRQDRPDLVLLDVMMSHILEGLDVSRQMQADPELREIPIIMVSSIADSPHSAMFPTDEYLSIDGWVSKPVRSDDLLEKVSRCLSERASR